MAHQLMERVQVAARSLHEFQRLGQGTDGFDRRIVDTRWSPGLATFGLAHRAASTQSEERNTRFCIDFALNGELPGPRVISWRG